MAKDKGNAQEPTKKPARNARKNPTGESIEASVNRWTSQNPEAAKQIHKNSQPGKPIGK